MYAVSLDLPDLNRGASSVNKRTFDWQATSTMDTIMLHCLGNIIVSNASSNSKEAHLEEGKP
jgi:hypothetical protein